MCLGEFSNRFSYQAYTWIFGQKMHKISQHWEHMVVWSWQWEVYWVVEWWRHHRYVYQCYSPQSWSSCLFYTPNISAKNLCTSISLICFNIKFCNMVVWLWSTNTLWIRRVLMSDTYRYGHRRDNDTYDYTEFWDFYKLLLVSACQYLYHIRCLCQYLCFTALWLMMLNYCGWFIM